jgi:Family of unknown function (DUF6152)
MFKTLICLAGYLLLSSSAVLAHHSYADYDRDQRVSIEGTLDQVTIGNPHAILTVKTDDGTLFTAEWQSAVWLKRAGVATETLGVGDRVIVTGSLFRDPTVHRMSLLTAIERPRDGWRWARK